MSSKQSNILDYIVCCIGAFAERFTLSNAQAYRYLHHYQGLAFLKKHYDIEHTFSVDDVLDDMVKVCKSNGGALSIWNSTMAQITRHTMTPSKDIQRQFLIECLTTDLAHILIEKRGYSMDRALDVIYNSQTYEKLENPNTRLYYQSTAYLEDILEEELGTFDYPSMVAEDIQK